MFGTPFTAQVSNKDGADASTRCLVKLDKLSRRGRASGLAGGQLSHTPHYAEGASGQVRAHKQHTHTHTTMLRGRLVR